MFKSGTVSQSDADLILAEICRLTILQIIQTEFPDFARAMQVTSDIIDINQV